MATRFSTLPSELLLELVDYFTEHEHICKLLRVLPHLRFRVRRISNLPSVTEIAKYENLEEASFATALKQEDLVHITNHGKLCRFRIEVVIPTVWGAVQLEEFVMKFCASCADRKTDVCMRVTQRLSVIVAVDNGLPIMGDNSDTSDFLFALGRHVYVLGAYLMKMPSFSSENLELWAFYAIRVRDPCKRVHYYFDFYEMDPGIVEDLISSTMEALQLTHTPRFQFHFLNEVRDQEYAHPEEELYGFFWNFLTALTRELLTQVSSLERFEEIITPISADIDLDDFFARFPQMPRYEIVVYEPSQVRHPPTSKPVTFYRAPGTQPFGDLLEYPIYRSLEECMRAHI